ncbi:562_t:CDS:2 [Cetraspora pellucida]|uniref:562_t:CDS:1 n=1 Tax=Cetraspora pellucida TaxID=1433469 RepID=A0ACA9NPN4_9GLOM|nr:562_t:CDS:2 [Cetraspora pellucida]
MGRIYKKYYSANATFLLDEVIQEIKGSIEIPNYSGQIPPDEWYQRINQILTLLLITAAAFDDSLRADILKSSIPDQISQTPAVNIQNKSHSDSSGISRAELDSMIKSQLALVPTTSIQSL